jgi:NitT/TauT family transport system permease protein
MIRLRTLASEYLPATLLFLAMLALWQVAVSVFGIREYLLPSPASVFHALTGTEDVRWWSHLWTTSLEILGAFVIAGAVGVLLGVGIAWSAVLARALVPFLVFVNTLPKVAVAPLFLLWLGYGILPNMLIGALIGFFPVVINTAVGLSQVEPELLDLGRAFNAPKWKIFAKIRLPNALPYILSALKITATAAVVGAIVGEFVASQKGLGYVIITTQSSMNTPVAFAALVWVSIVGLVLYGAVVAAARLLAPWAEGTTQ